MGHLEGAGWDGSEDWMRQDVIGKMLSSSPCWAKPCSVALANAIHVPRQTSIQISQDKPLIDRHLKICYPSAHDLLVPK